MQIKSSDAIRKNYDEVAALCRRTMEPVYLTENGEGDMVVIDIKAFERREKMLKLREALIAVEEERLAGDKGCTPDELEASLNEAIINAVKKYDA